MAVNSNTVQTYAVTTLRDDLQDLSAQYRSELDFSVSLLDQSKAGLDTLYGALKNAPATSTDAVDLSDNAGYLALLDDLNTPQVIAELHRLAKIVNKNEGQEAAIAAAQLQALGGLLGLLQQEPEAWFKATTSGSSELSAEDIEQLIVERKEAKLAKNYARADEIRKELTEKGIALEDSASGTSWKRI